MEKMSLSFKVDPRMKEALEDLAQKENRSLSNYVITLLLKHLEDKRVFWREGSDSKSKQKP
jgi:predicted transcriptional regulator